MNAFVKSRWSERSTRIQLLQVASILGSLILDIPHDQMALIVGTIAGAGVVTPDNK